MTCSTNQTVYDPEDVVQILCAFRDAAGDFVEPPAVKIVVTSPLGDDTELVYNTDDAVEMGTFEDADGTEYNFRASVQPIELEATAPEGKWRYKWIAEDDATPVEDRVAGAQKGTFEVE